MNNSHNNRLIYTLSFLLAFCSLTYELVFAQVLSVCLGGTKFQYLLTISIFTTALGIGSLLFGVIKNRFEIGYIFIFTEIILTTTGLIGPFLITWLLRIGDHSFGAGLLMPFLCYLLVFTVGLFSGLELPCLFSLSERNQGKIIAFDYLGMLCSSLFFPLIGLPVLGTAGAALMIANLNILSINFIRPFSSKMKNNLFLLVNLSCSLMIFYFREELNNVLTFLYLIGV
jgi:spermidine synthase